MLKMQLIQFQAGCDNAQMLGEKSVKDGSQFEEESSETDDEVGVKSGNQTDDTDVGKIERSDHASANFEQSNEVELADVKSEVESSNSSSGKLESIFEDENENVEEVYPEAAPNEVRKSLSSAFEGTEAVNVDKNVKSQESFGGETESVRGDLKKQQQMTKKDLERRKEELVYLREGAVAQAVLFITRQNNIISMKRVITRIKNIDLCCC